MNTLIAIAADFFEHLTNPDFGREANDNYALKFHVLMDNDSETAQRLATTPVGRDDVGSMSTAAWLWYLAWRESMTGERPSADFLDALYDETVNPILRQRIVGVSVQDVPNEQQAAGSVADAGLENIELNWIRNRIRDITRNGERDIRDENLQLTRVEDAWELLSYLIDIDSEASLEAARTLLNENWPGVGALRERTLGFIAQMQLIGDERPLRTQLGLVQ